MFKVTPIYMTWLISKIHKCYNFLYHYSKYFIFRGTFNLLKQSIAEDYFCLIHTDSYSVSYFCLMLVSWVTFLNTVIYIDSRNCLYLSEWQCSTTLYDTTKFNSWKPIYKPAYVLFFTKSDRWTYSGRVLVPGPCDWGNFSRYISLFHARMVTHTHKCYELYLKIVYSNRLLLLVTSWWKLGSRLKLRIVVITQCFSYRYTIMYNFDFFSSVTIWVDKRQAWYSLYPRCSLLRSCS